MAAHNQLCSTPLCRQLHLLLALLVTPFPRLQVPDYHSVIKDPMDLSLMETKLKRRNFYITLEIFIADFKRIIQNCK